MIKKTGDYIDALSNLLNLESFLANVSHVYLASDDPDAIVEVGLLVSGYIAAGSKCWLKLCCFFPIPNYVSR